MEVLHAKAKILNYISSLDTIDYIRRGYKVMTAVIRATHYMVKPYIAAHPLRIISNLLYGIKVNKFINLKKVNILYYSAGSL